MVLRYPQRVVVAPRQVLLQILFDVMPGAQALTQLNNAMRVALPIRGRCHRQVVSTPNLIQIDEFMGVLNDRQATFTIYSRLQRHPGKDAAAVKLVERSAMVNSRARRSAIRAQLTEWRQSPRLSLK